MANLKLWCSEKTKHRMSIRQKRLNMISRIYFFFLPIFLKIEEAREIVISKYAFYVQAAG